MPSVEVPALISLEGDQTAAKVSTYQLSKYEYGKRCLRINRYKEDEDETVVLIQ